MVNLNGDWNDSAPGLTVTGIAGPFSEAGSTAITSKMGLDSRATLDI